MEPKECNICCEPFNKSTLAKVECPFCKFEVCKTCVRKYLLSTTDASCMNCKKAWNRLFMIEKLNQSFFNTDFKTHQKQFLMEREIARLPESMELAARQNEIKGYEKEDKELKRQIAEHQKTIRELKLSRDKVWEKINSVQKGGGYKKKFIMACPDEHCRGMLSTAYKCEICKMFACPDCLTCIGPLPRSSIAHECDQSLVDTAKLIRESSKPCPACGEFIEKTEGCDQMWCTGCKTGFSWRTGEIDTGVIHNPHFYQYQQANNINIRNPADVVCGGLPNWWHTRSMFIQLSRGRWRGVTEGASELRSLIDQLTNYHRTLSHITYHELPTMRRKIREYTDHQDLRVKYINKEIEKKQLADTIYKHNNLRQKYIELVHIYELISAFGIERFTNIIQSTRENPIFTFVAEELKRFIDETNNFNTYINGELQKISATYKHVVIQVRDNFSFNNQKFTLSEIKSVE